MEVKRCSKCRKVKPLSEFWKRSSSKDGKRGECKACINTYFRKRWQETISRRREVARKSYWKHREQYILAGKKRNAKKRLIVLTHYGNGKLACVRCGFTDIRALSIDHIYGGGRQHIYRLRRPHIADWLYQEGLPDGYQTLCMNCQFIKKIEMGEDEQKKKSN